MADPKIVASLIWYDESPAWLAATLHGILPHIHHLVAIDGAYALYPGASAPGMNWSRPDQHEIIVYSCQSAGVGLTLHTPPVVWLGNEVEKRHHQLEYAKQVAEPMTDWVMIVDADEVVTRWPEDTIQRLADTEHDVAEVSYIEHHPASLNPDASPVHFNWGQDHSDGKTRNLFRALPDLRQGHNHYTVHGGNQVLRGNMNVTTLAPALALHDLQLDHRTHLRAKHRHDSQYTYYKRRDDTGIECDKCAHCAEQGRTTLATTYTQIDWEEVDPPIVEGRRDFTAKLMEVCVDCKAIVENESERQIRELTDGRCGLEDMQLTQGKVPA